MSGSNVVPMQQKAISLEKVQNDVFKQVNSINGTITFLCDNIQKLTDENKGLKAELIKSKEPVDDSESSGDNKDT